MAYSKEEISVALFRAFVENNTHLGRLTHFAASECVKNYADRCESYIVLRGETLDEAIKHFV